MTLALWVLWDYRENKDFKVSKAQQERLAQEVFRALKEPQGLEEKRAILDLKVLKVYKASKESKESVEQPVLKESKAIKAIEVLWALTIK